MLINISDHYTRSKMKSVGKPAPRVFGVLFGVQDGMTVHVHESYEMLNEVDEMGKVNFDNQFLNDKHEQIVQIFPHFEILGWYATGPEVQSGDLATHQALSMSSEDQPPLCENPLYLLLKPGALSADGETLPLAIYESQIHDNADQGGSVQTVFVGVDYTIDAMEPERIAVDHVSQVTPQGANQSPAIPHLNSLRSAIDTLVSRVDTLRNFLVATQNEEVPMNHPLLRQAASLCNQLPLMENDRLKQELLNESNDTTLVQYLTQLTECSNALGETMDKYATAYADGHFRLGGHRFAH